VNRNVPGTAVDLTMYLYQEFMRHIIYNTSLWIQFPHRPLLLQCRRKYYGAFALRPLQLEDCLMYNDGPNDFYKLVVLGDSEAGKTALTMQVLLSLAAF